MSLTVWYWQPAGLSENKDLWQILLMPLRKFSSLAAAAQCPDRGHFLPSQTQQKHNVNGNVKANTVFLMMNVSKWLVRSKFYTNFFFFRFTKGAGRENKWKSCSLLLEHSVSYWLCTETRREHKTVFCSLCRRNQTGYLVVVFKIIGVLSQEELWDEIQLYHFIGREMKLRGGKGLAQPYSSWQGSCSPYLSWQRFSHLAVHWNYLGHTQPK